MLVITRKKEQYIVINENIIVRVVGTPEGRMKLQIEAPREIPVVRGELWEKQQEEKAQGLLV